MRVPFILSEAFSRRESHLDRNVLIESSPQGSIAQAAPDGDLSARSPNRLLGGLPSAMRAERSPKTVLVVAKTP
jgi:hypothetical protein